MSDYESIAGYSSSNNGYSSSNNGFSSEDVGYSSTATPSNKLNELAKTSAIKKTSLDSISSLSHNDADTFKLANGTKLRLDGGVDTWEVFHPNQPRSPKLDLQREALAKLTGFSVNQITDQDVYEFGNKSNEYVKSILRKGQEGVANPQVAITTSDELDKFNRKLANVSNPVTGENLATALNNPLHNAGYDAFYNKSKKAADAYNPDRTAGELASDSLKSLAGKGTLGLSTLLAGAIDLPARAVGEALYRTGINDSTWTPNDATGLYEKINDAKTQINQSMSPTLKKEIALLDEKISTRDATRDFRTRKTAEQLGASETVKDFVIAPMKWGADVARDITDGLLDHPAAAVDMLLENVVTMGASGAAAKTGVKAVVAKTAQTAATEAKILAAANPTASSVTTANALSNVAEEATKLAAKSGELKSLATMTAQEVTGNTGETLSGVMNTPINELRSTSSDFRTAEKLFIAQGMSLEEAASRAQLQIANDSANAVAAMTAITAPLAAKLTGASKFESNLFNKTGVVGKAVGGLRSELPEETLQGFSGQLASNIAEQTYVDPSTKLSDGLAGATAKSALAGGLMGATIPAAIDITLKAPQALETAVGATGQVASKASTAIGNAYSVLTKSQEVKTLDQEIASANTTGDYSKVTTSTGVEPINIVQSLIESPPQTTDKVIQANYVSKLRENAVSIQGQLYDLIDATENLSSTELATPVNTALVTKLNELTEIFYKAKEVLDSNKATSTVDVDTRISEIVSSNTEPDTKTLGSILPRATEEQLNTLSSLVPEDSVQAEMITNRLEVLGLGKGSTKVSEEIRDGGLITLANGTQVPKLGYRQHQEAIQEAVEASNPAVATKALDKFSAFATGLKSKLAVYRKAGNLITAAEKTREAEIAKATEADRSKVRTYQNNLVAQAVADANRLFVDAAILDEQGKPVNYSNARTIHTTKQNISKDIEAVTAAIKESTYLVESISNRTKQENAAIDRAASKGTTALQTMKSGKESRLAKLDSKSPAASQIRAEIAYIDTLLNKATNVSNPQNDVPTSVATNTTKPSSDITQGSVGNQSADTTGSGLGDTTRASTQSSGTDVVSGTTSEQEDTLTVSDTFKTNVANSTDSAIEKSIEKLSKAVDKHNEGTKNPDIKAIQARLDYLLEVRKERLANAPDLAPPPTEVTELNSSKTESVNTEQPAKPKRKPIARRSARTLQGTLKELGGISYEDLLDITGESARRNLRAYKNAFSKTARWSLRAHIENGSLDQYLPYNMRLEANGMSDEAFDSQPGYDYLAELIKNGNKVLPYDAMQELRYLKYQGDIVNDTTQELTEDELDEEIQQTEYEEGTSPSSAQVTDTRNTDGSTNGSERTESTEVVNEPTITDAASLVTKLTKLPTKFNEFFNAKKSNNTLANNSDYFESIPEEYKGSHAFARISKFVSRFSPYVEKAFNARSGYGNDLIKLLLDSNGKLPKELVNIMAVSGYEWMLSTGKASIFNGTYAVSQILDIQEEQVTSNMLDSLSTVGTLRSAVAIPLGKQILMEAGITSKSTEVTEEHFENLASVVGLHTINALSHAGLVEHYAITADQVTAIKAGESAIDVANNYEAPNKFNMANGLTFIKLATQEGVELPTLTKGVEAVLKDSNATLKVLNTLQNKEASRPTHMLTKPTIKNVSKLMKDTIQKVAKKPLEIAIKYMQQELKIDSGNLTEFSKIPLHMQKKMLGYIESIDGKLPVVATNIKATQSTNLSVVTSIQKVNDFVTELSQLDTKLDTPFYVLSEFYKQMRLGMTSATIDPQNDKLHRMLVTRGKPHTVSNNDIKSEQYHTRALAQAFGVKTDGLDPFNMPRSIYDGLMHLDDIAVFERAAEALNEAGLNTLTDAQSELVIEAVTKGGEGMHTFAGIVALAAQLKALQEDKSSFETTLIFEIDGKTNGPIITLLQLAGASSLEELQVKMARGGMFSDGVTKSYFDYASKSGNLDTYEAFGVIWRDKISTVITKLSPAETKKYNAIESIIGSLSVPKIMRNLSKPVVTTITFGASTKNVLKAFSSNSLKSLYDLIEKHQNNSEELKNIENLIFASTGLYHKFTSKNVLDRLPIAVEKEFTTAVNTTYGAALFEAISEGFEQINSTRQVLNNAIQIAFELMKSRYDAKEASIIAENAKATPALVGITKAQRDSILADLLDSTPLIGTYFSKQLSESLVGYKKAKATVNKATYTGQANSSEPLTINTLNGSKYEILSSTAVASINYVEEPGVAPVIQTIHSLESSTMMLTLEELLQAGIPVLNIYDAIVVPADKVTEAGTVINKAFEKVMQEYDLASEFKLAYLRVLEGITPQEVRALNKFIKSKGKSMNGIESLAEFNVTLNAEVKRTNELKAAYLKTHTNTQQFVGIPANEDTTQNVPLESTEESVVRSEEDFSNDVSALLDEALEEAKNVSNNQDSLGSNQGGINPNAFQSDVNKELTEDNLNTVMDDLGKNSNIGTRNIIDSTTHKDHLVKLIASIAKEAGSKINGLMLRTKKSVGDTEGVQTDRYILLDVGTSPATDLQTMSAQEVFAHEITHSITEYGLRNNFLLRNQVEKLKNRVMTYLLKQADPLAPFLTFDSQGNVLTISGNTVDQERVAAQSRFDYIFGLDGSGKSWITKAAITGITVTNHNNNSIHEFVAFGRTNAKFMELLASEELNSELRTEFSGSVWNKNVFITLGNIFTKLLNVLVGQLTASTSLNADTQLDMLVGKLTKVLNRSDLSFQEYNPLHEKVADTAINKLTKLLVATAFVVANSNAVQKSKRPVVAVAGRVTNKIKHLPYATFRQWAKNAARRIGISDRNFAMAMMRETLRGRTSDNSYLYNFVSAYKHGVDQARNDIRTRAAQNLLSAFGNTKLTNSMKTVLLKTVVKLDLFLAVNEYGMPTVQKMLTDQSIIDTEVTNLQTQLKAITTLGSYNYINKMALSLGNRLVHGEGTEHLDHLGAKSIVNELAVIGLTVPTNLEEAERIADLLATLHGITKSSVENKQALDSLITTEYSKSADQLTEDGENGIQYLLEYSKDLRDRARDELFDGNSLHMEKGHTKDLIDPKVQFIVATPQEAIDQRLKEQGYELKAPIYPDNAHKAAKAGLGIYVNNFSVNATRITSSFSVMQDASRGTLITNTPVDEIIAYYKTTVAAQVSTRPTATNKVSMTPIRNLDNKIVGFRYMMNESTKDSVLQKNNSFEQVMGAMEADLSIKPAAKEINTNIIKALYKDYKANYLKDPNAYVAVSPRTVDKELQDIYRLLPREARETIKDTFGGDTFYIREQDVRLVFGYKKFSIGQFDKHWTPEQKATATVVQKVGMKVAEMLNSKVVLRGAHLWGYAVTTAKDVIVIKTGAVLVANIASNNAVLWTKGLSLKMIAQYQLEAIESFNKYQKDINTVKNIEMRIRLNPRLKTDIVVQGKLSNAKSAITNNPITTLLDAGVFQSIIEDVEATDVFSYRTVAEEYIGKVTDKIPQPLKTFGNVLILSHDTRAYKALKVTTQMSDFVARYALHKFNMDQLNKDGSSKFTKETSIEDINDTFILYDVPTSPEMQALNDAGLLMFTKYALRIKKVLYKAAVRAPGRTLNSLLISEYVTNTANMYDSLFTIGNTQDPLDVISTLADIPALELTSNVIP